jgi:hypothetical protein
MIVRVKTHFNVEGDILSYKVLFVITAGNPPKSQAWLHGAK